MKKHPILLGAVFIFVLFLFISVLTPLAGDDWGYAVNGLQGNPFTTAFEFYHNWSGRFFSELYGFIVTPRKWLWNILNPLLFTTILVNIYNLTFKKNNSLVVLTTIFLILSVNDHLRMETYSWLMGTTYVIPLAFCLIYLNISKRIIKFHKIKKQDWIFSNLMLFVIGLMMENIALTMIFASIILLIFNTRHFKFFATNTFASSLSFIILRLSPGAKFRLIRDNATWANKSIFDQMTINYPNFIKFTFLENKFLVFTLSIVFIVFIAQRIYFNKKIKVFDSGILSILVISFISSISLTLSSRIAFIDLNFLLNPSSLFNYIYWPIFMISLLISFEVYFEKHVTKRLVLLTVLSGISNGVMMASPIFGARSSIYTVFLIIAVVGIIIDQIEVNFKFGIVFTLILLTLVFQETNTYTSKYKLVNLIQKERIEIYKYHRTNLDDKEAWIPRMPIYTVHGSDIEPDDFYHFEVFKKYYDLPEDLEITFYFKEKY